MSEHSDEELSREDIEFLTTVRDVCDNPENYDGTDEGEAPATVTVLVNETTLTKSQVAYRMYTESSSQKERGFAEDQLGYIRTYKPAMNETGWGPRSCEITDKGRDLLSEVRDQLNVSVPQLTGGMDGVQPERIEELEETVERLDNQLSTFGERLTEMRDILEGLENSEFGAVDEEMSYKLESALDAMITYNNIFEYVLGTDVRPFHPDEDGMIDAEMIAEGREQVVSAINATSESDAAEELRRK